MSLRKCLDKAEKLVKLLERLDEAEVAYGTNQRYLAAAKVGAAWTSLALAYAKGVIDYQEYRNLAGYLAKLRSDILSGVSFEDLLKDLESTRHKVIQKFESKVMECYVGKKGEKDD